MNIGIKDVIQRIGPFFILYLVLLCACLIIKLTFTKEEIYFAVNAMHSTWADNIAPFFTDLGNGWTTVLLSAVLLLFNYHKAFLMATTYAITALLAQVVKYIFDAPRPKLYFKDRLSQIHFVKDVYILTYHSFPSGHTVTAFSTGLLIAYWCNNKSWGIVFCLLAAMIGYSRMYLSQHFFEDVTIGSMLGVFVTIIWLAYIDKKQFLQTDKWNSGPLKY